MNRTLRFSKEVISNDGLFLCELHHDTYGEPLGSYSQSAFGFAGEQTDANGLVYLRARYMNPATGMFLSKDPVEGFMQRPMSRNGYSYVEGNPSNWTDPSGEFVNILVGAVLGGAIGAIGGYVYAEAIYIAAARGDCGCKRKQEVLSIGEREFVKQVVIQGAIMGAVFGGVASLGPVGLVAVGTFGILQGGQSIIHALQAPDWVVNGQVNLCNALDLALGLLSVVGGFTLGALGANQLAEGVPPLAGIIKPERVPNLPPQGKGEPVRVYHEIRPLSPSARPLGQFDTVEFFADGTGRITEEKSAMGVGRPFMNRQGLPQVQDTPETWALRQIYESTDTKLSGLVKAIGVDAEKGGPVPSLAELRSINNYRFAIDSNAPEIIAATESKLVALRGAWRGWTFTAKYGP